MADPLIAKLIEADQPYQDFLLFFLHNFLDLELSYFLTLKVRIEKKETMFDLIHWGREKEKENTTVLA